ncbi:MAG: single-stranded-DNA-specific exonuclease RecJ, partial [Clostridiaceae bacterium]|nr:single-stranded-DNA-specific exonuclease RecJ [Clostridiaceae bacterium]
MESFLAPGTQHFHDPFLMKGMNRAAERVVQAIDKSESVLIYGDYDVDGVAATSILVDILRREGLRPEFYIPDRAEEGYGISDAAVDMVCDSTFDLMITVDCGITAKQQVEAIQKRRFEMGKPLDIIITDHHQCQ